MFLFTHLLLLYDILFSTSCYLWKCSTSATRTDNQNRENILHVLDKEPTIYSSEDHCCSCLLKRNLSCSSAAWLMNQVANLLSVDRHLNAKKEILRFINRSPPEPLKVGDELSGCNCSHTNV